MVTNTHANVSHAAAIRMTGSGSTGGRNRAGRITSYHRGGGHKRLLRAVRFDYVPASNPVAGIYYDPSRGGLVTCVIDRTGKRRTRLRSEGETSQVSPSQQLKDVAAHVHVHSIELVSGKGAQLIRGAGCFGTVVNQVGHYTRVRLPSGEERLVHGDNKCRIGAVAGMSRSAWSHALHQRGEGKAGRTRWLGRRPTVRGTAMNPVDHPHGGGQGKTSGGRPSVTPWSVPKGVRTSAGRGAGFVVVSRRQARGI